VDRAEVIEAYWRHYRQSTSDVRADRLDADESFWAWEAVYQSVDDPDDDVMALLSALADAAPDVDALAYLGAGPIENLLYRHAARFGDEVEAAARRDEKFRTALRCAWFDNRVDPQLAARLRRFGPPL
jgi:hypothetical protein